MHCIILILLFVFAATAVEAAWYQKSDGTKVDPIMDRSGQVLAYSGNNLEPHALLYKANLTGALLTGALLANAGLGDTNLSGSILTGVLNYNEATWTDAFYYTDSEPTWASGMDAAWRSRVGIEARDPLGEGNAVHEPAAILLALFGLALLPRRRQQ